MRKCRRAGLFAAVFGVALPGAAGLAYGQAPVPVPPPPPPAAVAAAQAQVAQTPAPATDSLPDAVAYAYETNPQLLTQRSILRNQDEAFFRARANALGPTLTADIGISASQNNDFTGGTGGSSGATQITATVGASQTLYAGGRLSATMEGQRAALMSARESLRSTEHRVLQQVVSAYTDVRRTEQQLEIANAQVQVLTQQHTETQVRFEVGAATITEVAQAQSRAAQARTQAFTAQNNVLNARTQYLTVVGKAPGTLAAEPSLASALPSSLEDAHQVALRNNPAIRQAYLSEQQSAAQIAVARAARRPTISIRPSISASQPISGGFNNDFDAGLAVSGSISIPLFPGRTTSSTIRSAYESNTQDRIGIESQMRTLNQNVTTSWNALVAARAQIVSQQEAVTAARLATTGTREEEDVGLRTPLDLLNAEQEQRQAEQALVNAQFSEYTAAVALLVAMGVLEPETFGASVDRYDPELHFREINGRPLPWESFIERIDQVGAAPIRVREPGPSEVVPTFEAPDAP